VLLDVVDCKLQCAQAVADHVWSWLSVYVFLLSSSRLHQSYDVCLEVKEEDYQICSVLRCVRQLCTMICTHKSEIHRFSFWNLFVFFQPSWCVYLVNFVAVCFVFTALWGLVSSMLAKRLIGWEEGLRIDIACVEWDINIYAQSVYEVEYRLIDSDMMRVQRL